MQDLELGILWWQRLLGPVVVLTACVLLLVSPIRFPWRVTAVLLLLIGGLLIWQRYLASRPYRLRPASDGGLICEGTDGQQAAIDRVLVGIAHPRLVCARLTLADGRRVDLWVPGSALHPDLHRQLRARLLQCCPS